MAKIIRLPIDTSDLLALTPLLLKFIGEYCANNFDEVSAYRKTWPQKAREMSSAEIRLDALNVLNQREVKIAVQRFVDSILSPYRDRLEHQLFDMYRQRAFYDPADFFNSDGSPKKLDQIDKEKRVVLDNLLSDLKGKDANAWLLNYKLADRMQAAKALQDIMGKSLELNEQAEELQDTSRSRIRDIVSGALTAIEMKEKNTKEKKAKEEAQPAEYEDVYTSPALEAPDYDAEIPVSPIVNKAREFAIKNNAGINVESDPLVKQAKELARRPQGIDSNTLKGMLDG